MNRANIDEIDAKIISALQKDPRMTFLKLGEHCQISIDRARKRYMRLRKEGIVMREIIALLPKAVGLDFLAWIGIITQPGKENEVLKYLTQRPEIALNYVEIGEYNIRSSLGLSCMGDLVPFIDSLKKIPYVIDINVMIWDEIQQMIYPTNLVIEPFSENKSDASSIELVKTEYQTSSTSFVSQSIVRKAVPFSIFCPSIDKIDEGILNILLQNARTPFINIAKQLGVSDKTVICRYKRIKDEWIAYSTLSLNLSKLGYLGYVSYNIKVSAKGWIPDVLKELVKIPNIIAALKLIGPYDINVLAPFSNPEQIFTVYKSITEIPGIEKISQQLGDSMHVWPTY